MPKLRHVIQVTNPNTKKKGEVVVEASKIFRVVLSHDTLENYYKSNFAMMQHHKYSLEEIENMLPWEREIYVGLLMQYIKDEKEKVKTGTTKNERIVKW